MHTHILFLSFLINKLIGNATIYQTARIAIYAAITNPNTAPTITPSITTPIVPDRSIFIWIMTNICGIPRIHILILTS